MRDGARFITSGTARKVNLNYIVKRLNKCSDFHSGCEGCPDLSRCVKAYDERCGKDDLEGENPKQLYPPSIELD